MLELAKKKKIISIQDTLHFNKHSMSEYYTIVVRSVNERTTDVSVGLLKDIFQQNTIQIVNETPFARALEKTFQIGIKENRKWLICIDADVLVSKSGLINLISKIEEYSENTFEIQGLVLDKFFNRRRPAGNHIYRTELLPKALPWIKDAYKEIRPESFIIKQMAGLGYPNMQTDILVGLHDFEQYYIDILRKTFVHARKHNEHIEALLKQWKAKEHIDKDYFVASLGAQVGLEFRQEIPIDKNFMEKEFEKILKNNNIHEKKKLLELSDDYVTKIMEGFISNEDETNKRTFKINLFSKFRK